MPLNPRVAERLLKAFDVFMTISAVGAVTGAALGAGYGVTKATHDVKANFRDKPAHLGVMAFDLTLAAGTGAAVGAATGMVVGAMLPITVPIVAYHAVVHAMSDTRPPPLE